MQRLVKQARRLNGGAAPTTPVVQRWFNMGSMPYTYNEQGLIENLWKAPPHVRRLAQQLDYRRALLDMVEQLSRDAQRYPVNTYEKLFGLAARNLAVARAAAAPAPQVETHVARHQEADVDYRPDALPRNAKVRRLGDLRRASSLAVSAEVGLDRHPGVKVIRHVDDPGQEYTVGGYGNLLLGGPTDHSYEALFNSAMDETQTDDRQFAATLIRGLRGHPMPGDANRTVRKIVTLIHSSELFRAAINPAAMIAALEHVVINGGNIVDAIRNNVLFAKTEGGSKRSQFHRLEEVDQTEDEFQAVAANEHDRLAESAARHGYDPSNPEQFEHYVTLLTQSLHAAREQLFRGRPRPAMPPAGGPQGDAVVPVAPVDPAAPVAAAEPAVGEGEPVPQTPPTPTIEDLEAEADAAVQPGVSVLGKRRSRDGTTSSQQIKRARSLDPRQLP